MKIVDTFSGKPIRDGHLLAIRYNWNSYVGEVRRDWFYATGSLRLAHFPHSIDGEAGAYQIIGHADKNDEDYNEEVFKWYNSEDEYDCPVKIKIYDNQKENKK